MKYYLEINGHVFPNVSVLDVLETYRNETVTKTLGGDLVVERVGNRKYTINARLNMITPAYMGYLRYAKLIATETTCKFYQGETLKEINAVLSPFTEPSPIYYFGDREKGMIYGSVDIILEEV